MQIAQFSYDICNYLGHLLRKCNLQIKNCIIAEKFHFEIKNFQFANKKLHLLQFANKKMHLSQYAN